MNFGVEQAFFQRRLVLAVTAFERNTANQIDFISCFNNPLAICLGRPFGTYDNVARARADGIETTLEARPTARLSLSAGYTTLDARNRSVGTASFDRRLARRLMKPHFVTAGYEFDFGLDLSATWSMVGDSFNNASNSQPLAGYELITVRASQKIGEIWSIHARIENASDEVYETTTGYGLTATPGICWGSVRLSSLVLSVVVSAVLGSTMAGCSAPPSAPSTELRADSSRPLRVVSLDYCADQFVLKLATGATFLHCRLMPPATFPICARKQPASRQSPKCRSRHGVEPGSRRALLRRWSQY